MLYTRRTPMNDNDNTKPQKIKTKQCVPDNVYIFFHRSKAYTFSIRIQIPTIKTQFQYNSLSHFY